MAEGFLNQISVFGRVYDITSNYDAELDENSENAVQNKVLTEKITDLNENKADQTSLDETNEDIERISQEIENKADQTSLDETNEALANLEDEILNIIPIEIEEIDDLFGLN